MTREDRIEAARKKMSDAVEQLKSLKPAFACKCGETFIFLVPAVCKCGRKTDPKGCVKFDTDKYQRFQERADEVGVFQATRELEFGELDAEVGDK